MNHVVELLSLVNGSLDRLAKSDIVTGAPIELGGVTLVPISRVSFGIGAGGGQGEGEAPGAKKSRKPQAGEGLGGGAGAGGKVRPVAVAVFGPGEVRILSIPEEKGALEKLLDKVPDLIEQVKDIVGKKEVEPDETSEEEGEGV